MVGVHFPVGGYVLAHFLNEPFQPVRVFLFQLRILGFSEENIFISAKQGGSALCCCPVIIHQRSRVELPMVAQNGVHFYH